jgi:putative nucleotidyltransferase with HDIG domain
MNWQPKQPALRLLIKAFLEQTAPIYVVGGVVRDYLLAQQSDKNDIDLVVEQGALPIAKQVADRLGWAFYPLDSARDVARLVFTSTQSDPLVCDVAGMRGGSLGVDLRLRDFTVNAMAFVLGHDRSVKLVDLYGGQHDLALRQLRRVTATSFAEDPARLLRAIRFVHQLHFSLEQETETQIKRMSTTVRLASPERLRDELWKILAVDAPAPAIDDLRAFGLLPHVLPEVGLLVGVQQARPHYLDVYQHTLRTVEYVAQLRQWVSSRASTRQNDLRPTWEQPLGSWLPRLRQHFAQSVAAGHTRGQWLVWYALLHDIGKPATRSVELDANGQIQTRFLGHEQVGAELTSKRLDALRFSRQESTLAQMVVHGHMRPHLLHTAFPGQSISRRAAYRFFRETGGKHFSQLAGIDVLMLALGDYLATHQATPPLDWPDYLAHVEQLLAFTFAKEGLDKIRQNPLLDGHTLMAHLQLQPSRQVGEILEHVMEAQAAGEIQTTEQALAVATQWLHEQN